MKIFASLGILGILLWLSIACALVYTWFTGVAFGFHHGIVLGLVSLLPPVGIIEGILSLAGVI
jgi:accessory gene regulator protein AgrB